MQSDEPRLRSLPNWRDAKAAPASATIPPTVGRHRETRIDDDHRLENATYPVLELVDGAITQVDEPALTALNMRLRDDYSADCAKGVERWNKIIARSGVAPNVAFHREIGEFRDVHVNPAGELIDTAAWERQKDQWLPSQEDGDFITELMQPMQEPGQSGSCHPRSGSTTSRGSSNT